MPDRVEEVPGRMGSGTAVQAPRVSARGLRALASLIGDEDERIASMVWDNLLRLGTRALPYLAELEDHADPRTRLRARHVKMRIQAQRLERRFRRLAQRRNAGFDLETALTLVAQVEYPDLEPMDVALQLDDLADGLRPRIQADMVPEERIEALNGYLFRDLGFRGNRERYHDPDNSFIQRVIERRRGIPITLAAVMILVGRRIGLTLHGVGMPRNFLVRYKDKGREIFVDPFNGGRILSREECARILTSEGYYVREAFVGEFLAVASPRDMTIRMLRNLILIYSKQRLGAQVTRMIRFADILREHEHRR
ncbi:MAG: transglutaminase family protein [Candidatus Eisenbacteria bacterium]|uniref:Transglutaminase family protein n=1 Tax=Eiseniibacteriota bacterium TaxID=2212470 RepID=A0A938BPZ7_UNCEI|nr:transglutaminase family protein [Candidatus Eisenbacteria bacterium]